MVHSIDAGGLPLVLTARFKMTVEPGVPDPGARLRDTCAKPQEPRANDATMPTTRFANEDRRSLFMSLRNYQNLQYGATKS